MSSSSTTTTTPMFPNQEQPQLQQQEVPFPQAVPSNAWHNNNNNKTTSGSIGPFFAVISVLAVLAIISCLLGRFWIGKEETPLESIKYRGSCFDRLRRRIRRCFSRDVEGGGGRGGRKVANVAPTVPDERGIDGS